MRSTVKSYLFLNSELFFILTSIFSFFKVSLCGDIEFSIYFTLIVCTVDFLRNIFWSDIIVSLLFLVHHSEKNSQSIRKPADGLMKILNCNLRDGRVHLQDILAHERLLPFHQKRIWFFRLILALLCRWPYASRVEATVLCACIWTWLLGIDRNVIVITFSVARLLSHRLTVIATSCFKRLFTLMRSWLFEVWVRAFRFARLMLLDTHLKLDSLWDNACFMLRMLFWRFSERILSMHVLLLGGLTLFFLHLLFSTYITWIDFGAFIESGRECTLFLKGDID